MRTRRILFILIVTLFVSTMGFAQKLAYNTINVSEIRNSLPSRPISVGFDVDDTVLFSSPGFYYGKANTDGPNNTNKYGKKFIQSDRFWSDMNSNFDRFSIPKHSAKAIIDMHKERGDKVYFITARPKTKVEILTKILNRTFGLKNRHPVIFSGKITKGRYIRQKNIRLFYGDSDSDIREAHDVGVRAIRFMRSPLSTNLWKYNPGKYGESVLENSEN